MKAALFLALVGTLPPRFDLTRSEIELSRAARPGAYCEASGPRAALLGSEDGVFEAWIYPFKILHGLRFSAEIEGSLTPVPLSTLSRQITVRPESTTLTFSHMAFTIQLTIFVPTDLPAAVLLFDVRSARPLTLYADLATDLTPMWPGGMGGQFSTWDGEKKAFLLSESRRKYAAYVGSPAALRGSDLPAHNLPDTPTRMVMGVAPEDAAASYIPLVVTGSVEGVPERGAPARAWEVYGKVLAETEKLYADTRERYEVSRRARLRVETPEPDLNLAAEWAAVALEKLRVCNPDLGCGLVAGLGRSGLSLRPGFGWFFGGDTFINSLALTSVGAFDLTREALTLIRKNQREDGKMMHELSQAGGQIPWFKEFPYGYYHADTTPWYLVALHDYVRASGDRAYLEESWGAALAAYRYCLSTDGDGDGLMENAKAGLGAVETGKLLGNLHTDVYLAAVWTRALEALADMARWRGDERLAGEAKDMAERCRKSLHERFWDPALGRFAFALVDGGASKSNEATVWPAVGIALSSIEPRAGALDLLASAELSTDWGTRMLSSKSVAYEPLSYNNGSVWPFLTGFASWASYAGRRSGAGYAALLPNARHTWLDGLGYHPELLSGDFHQVVETAVPHQGFSSFGVLAPLVHGLLGITADEPSGVLHVAPQLPPSWDRVSLKNVRMGAAAWDLSVTRSSGTGLSPSGAGVGPRAMNRISLGVNPLSNKSYRIQFDPMLPAGSRVLDVKGNDRVSLAPSVVEIQYESGPEVEISTVETPVGSESTALKLIAVIPEPRAVRVVVEGVGGKEYTFLLHHAPRGVRKETVRFSGRGYVRRELRFTW